MLNRLKHKKVTIIGAGIAGLTTAIALAQRGAEVTVLERADALREVGAGLQLSPNAVRVLDALGLGEDLRRASLRSAAVQLRNSMGGHIARLDLIGHRPADDFRLIHRARLIEILGDAAKNAGAEIRFDQQITHLPEAPLLIGADGLRSTVRSVLNGREVPFFTHQTAWRAVIRDDSSDADAQIYTGPRRHLVSYPLAGGLRNIVAVQERFDWQDEGWSHQDDPDNLRAAFGEFGGAVPAWLAAVEETHIWGLFRHNVAARWQDGRIALIGDAAHPSLPFMAQGAAMAIEDAWILAACLDADPDQSAALSRYEELRKPRVQKLVAAANANARNYHMTGLMRVAAHSALRLASRFAPQKLLSRYDWIYDYNPLDVLR